MRLLSRIIQAAAMPVPTYDRFFEPILRYLASHPDGAPARDVHEAAAAALGLSEIDRAELVPSGVQFVYKNRAGCLALQVRLIEQGTDVGRGVIHHLREDHGARRRERPARPPEVQSGGWPCRMDFSRAPPC